MNDAQRLTREQVRAIDRLAIERYAIPGIVLMENASRAVADIVERDLIDRGMTTGQVLVLCGGGNNGGDGLAAARHLHNRSIDVRIGLYVDPTRYTGDALINWRIAQAMSLPTLTLEGQSIRESIKNVALIVDGLFGTGLSQPPRPPFSMIADALSSSGVPILAIDVPSGLDCDTGLPLGSSCIRAVKTVTFVAEKIGFANPDARQYLGETIVADIGTPRELIDLVRHEPPPT